MTHDETKLAWKAWMKDTITLTEGIHCDGTNDRMARLLDETFEMLVMAQYSVARHGGVEAIEVSVSF